MLPPTDSPLFAESTLLSGRPGAGRTDANLGAPSAKALPAVERFDACQVGVVLRAVLFVEAVVAVAALFLEPEIEGWLQRFALLTGAVIPATFVWLIATCSLKRALNRLSSSGQWLGGCSLGALAGLYGCAQLAMSGLLQQPPWMASAAAGAMLSSMLLAGLFWRAKARTPAATAARLAELQSRIRPHFLFNTLNTAIALVRAEPRKAESVLEDLSELFRSALAEQAESVTLSQEIALAQRYLAIEEIRFGSRLRIEWQLDAQAANAMVPPLLLQPLVENAVKHGVEPSASGADVKISTEKRGSMVVVKVTNSCPAGTGASGHGLALANVRERLALLHDVQASFRTVLIDGVFQVRLELPA